MPTDPPDRSRAIIAALIAAVVALAAGFGIGITTNDDDGDGVPDRVTITRTVTQPAKTTAEAPPAGDLEAVAPDGARATEEPAQSPLRDETPPDVPESVLESGAERTDDLADRLPPPAPVGGAQNYSCTQDFSGTVYSSRNGVRPTEWVNHYTVSPNVTGWSDVRGIQAYFKRTRVASSTYIIDFEGHCLQMVPESAKPWTQGAANPWAISVEIIATGRETRAQWLASPLIRDGILAALTRDSARRNGIPLRRVDPNGCVFTPGITDHNALECGNDHTDVAPSFPWDVYMKQVVDGPAKNPRRGSSYRLGVLRPGERDKVACLLHQRRRYHAKGEWPKPAARKRARACKAGLRRGLRYYQRKGTHKDRQTVIRKVIAGKP